MRSRNMRRTSMDNDYLHDPKILVTLQYFQVTEDMQPIVTRVAVGDDIGLEGQLIRKSLQPHIVKYTPNDSEKRFVDNTTFKLWYEDGHTVHWLLNAEGDLGGIIWYRKKTMPVTLNLSVKPVDTFAIRLYEGYVGHHLSNPFMKLSIKIHVMLKKERGETINTMWLETTTKNSAAIASYNKFGYKEVFRNDDIVLMVIDSEKLIEIANSIQLPF
jgi:hypothetical protein